jgi:hypothetical protein
MLNQKKVEIFLAKFHKSLTKQFLEIAFIVWLKSRARLEVASKKSTFCNLEESFFKL